MSIGQLSELWQYGGRSPFRRQLVVVVISFAFAGCRKADDGHIANEAAAIKAPRAVLTFPLKASTPSRESSLTGSAEAWKSEEIGFEVPGRVSWIIEPNEDIQGRLPAATASNQPPSGTVIAKLDDERYQLAVASAKATVNRFSQDKQALAAEISDSIPAQIVAANANIELAEIEFDRLKSLVSQNASSRAEFDRSKANLANVRSELSALEASLKVKQAQLLAVEAQIEQAQTQVAEAQRDLKDCWLYSSFRGQVAAVHVVPGSIVAQGEKVATVQLMDPMKIELEVSASDSRQLKPRDTVRISTNGEGGQSNSQVAIIYMIDAVADPQTRTSTVTLLCRNRKTRTPVPPELASESIARTERIFPLNTDFVDENTNQILAEVRAIHRDDEGTYVWRITNRRFGEVSQGMRPLLEVEKVRVQCGEESISFLGNWNLVPITVVGDATLNPKQDLLTGQIVSAGGTNEPWNGHSVLFENNEWMIRPGDLVSVDMSSEANGAGWYVPVRAVRHESGQTFVFILVDEDNVKRTRKIEVRLVAGESSQMDAQPLLQIEPLADIEFEGQQIIVGGVHYIEDGEVVRVSEAWRGNQ